MSQYARLNQKFSKNKDILETQAIRIHRALSWLKCAEEQEKNIDLAFLSLWVSFNACYANDLGQTDKKTEKDKFRGFIEKLARLDMEKRIFKLLWEKFSGPVRILIENRYVYKPFWDYQRKEISSWEGIFRQSITDANSFLAKGNVPALLEIVLDRLFVWRVPWLVEHSTSHQLLCWVDSFGLRIRFFAKRQNVMQDFKNNLQ